MEEGLIANWSQGDPTTREVNKENVIAKLNDLLTKAFTVKKKRKPTKPTKASVQKRLEQKKKQSEKKRWRKE